MSLSAALQRIAMSHRVTANKDTSVKDYVWFWLHDPESMCEWDIPKKNTEQDQ